MKLKETKLGGVFLVESEPIHDERGFFARSWSYREFEDAGINPRTAEHNISYNARKGTVRGMHFQAAPYAQAKLVRCTAGSIYDVVLDLRPDSPTYMQWFAVELSAKTRLGLFVPEGFAHGFQTLEDDTEVFYQTSEYYHPESAGGLRWDDPKLGIPWPLPVSVISPRDRTYSLL